MERWSEERAATWWERRGWVCGVNFLPSTAVNFLEMWHPDSFDPTTIARELRWAGETGFNACRVNLHSLVWEHDREGLIARIEWFLAQADQHGLATVLCPFDDCGFGGAEPVYGPQPDPVPGVHNSRAVASPGRASVMNRATWPVLEGYLRDIVARFRTDPRILFWDLYNEPGNRMQFSSDGFSRFDGDLDTHAQALMEAAFGWARSEAPDQPLTVGAWTTPLPNETVHPYQTAIDRSALMLSDIVTFHAYLKAEKVARFIDYLEVQNRPIICTEWMARAVDSRIEDQLRLFRDRNVGCFQWGLVQGRTQTDLPWPQALVAAHGGDARRDVWFHDVLHKDGTPYDPGEVEVIRTMTGTGPRPGKGRMRQ